MAAGGTAAPRPGHHSLPSSARTKLHIPHFISSCRVPVTCPQFPHVCPGSQQQRCTSRPQNKQARYLSIYLCWPGAATHVSCGMTKLLGLRVATSCQLSAVTAESCRTCSSSSPIVASQPQLGGAGPLVMGPQLLFPSCRCELLFVRLLATFLVIVQIFRYLCCG